MAVIGHHCPTTTTLSRRFEVVDDTFNGYGALAGQYGNRVKVRFANRTHTPPAPSTFCSCMPAHLRPDCMPARPSHRELASIPEMPDAPPSDPPSQAGASAALRASMAPACRTLGASRACGPHAGPRMCMHRSG